MQSSQADLGAVIECLNEGEFQQAIDLCDEVLASDQENAKAWHLRGIGAAQLGDIEAAADSFQKATEIRDDVPTYHYNLALAYQSLDRLDEAIEAYRRAVERKADFVEAQTNLGNCIANNGDLEGAIEHFRELTNTFSDQGGYWFNLANLIYESGELIEAIQPYRRAIEVSPDLSEARENLARTLLDVMREDEAVEVWKQWLEHDPENPVARHLLASSGDGSIPDRCEDDYVLTTFGGEFAQDYDEELERLEYRVPELIAAAVENLELGSGVSNVLDAGCGTGLCGDVLRPVAERLEGIDLSTNMLEQAAGRELYDELFEGELTEFLQSQPQSYDLIVCGDTLCYFGKLDDVLSGFADRLREGGHLVFTVEAIDADEGEESIDLQTSGRYRHSESYLRETLEQAGFAIVDLSSDWLRKERGHEVPGLVVTAKKSDSAAVDV